MIKEPEVNEEFIREVLADVINEGYGSELSVSWIKAMLKDAWEEGKSAGHENQMDWDGWRYSKGFPIENPYK